LLSLSIMHFQRMGLDTRLKVKEWGLFSAGSFVIILSFIWDYWEYIRGKKLSEIVYPLSDQQNLFSNMVDYVPVDFNWPLFVAGETILLYAIIIFIRRINHEYREMDSIAFIY